MSAPSRRVLTLAYHFPPYGGAGVQRNAQLARRLADLGWSQTVISGPARGGTRWTPLDADLAGGAPLADVRRLPDNEPHAGRWGESAERWLRTRSVWRRWWHREVLRLAPELGGGIEVVHASVAPYQTAETAVALSRLLDVPLVVDLEDPWALDDMLVYPTTFHRRLEQVRMGRILKQADLVVMNTEEAGRRVRAAFPCAEEVVAISNSFDPNDFAGTAPARADQAFRIVHTGSFHTDLGLRARQASRLRRALGGYERDADFLARSPAYLLEAIRAALDARPELGGRLELHLAGVLTAEDERLLAGEPFVRHHGFLTHEQTIALIRSGDLLFLPLYDLPSDKRTAIVPQKTYEYVASGRPILAAVPDGDARDLLAACGTARVCRPADVTAMTAAILDVAAGEAPAVSPPSPEVMRSCDAERMAAELAAAFERVAARRHVTARTAVAGVAPLVL